MKYKSSIFVLLLFVAFQSIGFQYNKIDISTSKVAFFNPATSQNSQKSSKQILIAAEVDEENCDDDKNEVKKYSGQELNYFNLNFPLYFLIKANSQYCFKTLFTNYLSKPIFLINQNFRI